MDERLRDELMTAIERLEKSQAEKFERLEKSHYQIHKLITGNGDPEEGYIFRTVKLEEKVDAIRDEIKADHHRRSFWIKWAVAGSLSAVATSAWAWFTAHTKITP